MTTDKNLEEKNDKRLRERVYFSTKFALTIDGTTYQFEETCDLSMSGVFLVTDMPLKIGTKGDFSFFLNTGKEEGPEIKGKFELANEQEKHGRTGKHGVGIKFTDLDPDSSVELFRVIRYNRVE